MLANMIVKPRTYIRDLVNNEECKIITMKFMKTVQSLTYIVKSELSQLDDNFDSNFTIIDGQHPPILGLYLSGKIGPETLIIIDDLIGCFDYWNKNIQDTIIWPDVYRMCQKYKPFLSEVYDKDKMKTVIMGYFQAL